MIGISRCRCIGVVLIQFIVFGHWRPIGKENGGRNIIILKLHRNGTKWVVGNGWGAGKQAGNWQAKGLSQALAVSTYIAKGRSGCVQGYRLNTTASIALRTAWSPPRRKIAHDPIVPRLLCRLQNSLGRGVAHGIVIPLLHKVGVVCVTVRP